MGPDEWLTAWHAPDARVNPLLQLRHDALEPEDWQTAQLEICPEHGWQLLLAVT